MNDAVILSHSLVMSRYAGPYVAANSARKAGYQVKILDYFCHHNNIEEYIKPHVGPNTKLLAISSTFVRKKNADMYKRGERSRPSGARNTWYDPMDDQMSFLHCNSTDSNTHLTLPTIYSV